MEVDLELYRHEVRVSSQPLVRLSAIDLNPDHPRRTFLFLHGYAGNALQWEYQLKDFSLSNRLIALDLRGHGLSDKPHGSYSMDILQDDIKQTLNLLDVQQKIILIGHSFGAAIAAQFATKHPELVDKLILIAATGEHKLNLLYRFALNLPLGVLRIVELFTRSWLSAPPHVLKPWYHNTLSPWIGWSTYRDIPVPTLVVRGYRDTLFSRKQFEEVARAIPNAEEANVGASGHMVMLERRKAVNRAIERFLESERGTWRVERSDSEDKTRSDLINRRPWLVNYDTGVPYTISIPNIPLQRLLRSAVRRFPLQKAIDYEGKSLSYRRLNQEANRCANALKAFGINKGDRVLLLLPNIPQWVIAFFGILKAGGVAVLTLPTSPHQELIRQIENCGAKVIITLPHFKDLAYHAVTHSDVSHVMFTSPIAYLPVHKKLAVRLSRQKRDQLIIRVPQEEWAHPFQRTLYTQRRRSPEFDADPSDLAAIIYTGGTTAVPKGVMLTHRNLIANALQTRHWMADAVEGKERLLCVLPFSHSYGLTTALNVPISLGATLILKAQFDIEDTLKTIKRKSPTIFPGVPMMYVNLSNYPGVRRYGIQSIRACISGAAPLPVEVQESFEKLTRGRLVEGYGLTESSPVTHANPLIGRRKIGSIGIPVPSTEAKVVDLIRGRKEVPVGQIGELAVKGPQVMAGYWQDEKATKSVITRDGWLLTGDVAQMDEDGYFRIVARKADMWYPTKPGEPAFPRDVEEVLYEIPQITEAAVVAITRKPIAFIIAPKDRPSSDSIIAYCKRRLPPELVPRLVIFVDEFPRTFIGKVLRRELAKHYERYHDESIEA